PFFASPKKGRPKKGEPKSGPLRGSLRCSRRGGNSQTCPLRGLRTCEFLIPTPLRCSARPHGKAGSDFPSCAIRCFTEKAPSARAEERRPGRIKGCACLSRRRVCADPAQGEHRRVPAAQWRVSGSRGRFLCLLSLSTQRK